MQKRAIRDAKTPDKMKKSVSVKEDGNLNLQEKKEKIKAGLKKLTELGTVNAKNKYQELINDIAKVYPDGFLVIIVDFSQFAALWNWHEFSEGVRFLVANL